jgi:hypothetical protein
MVIWLLAFWSVCGAEIASSTTEIRRAPEIHRLEAEVGASVRARLRFSGPTRAKDWNFVPKFVPDSSELH